MRDNVAFRVVWRIVARGTVNGRAFGAVERSARVLLLPSL